MKKSVLISLILLFGFLLSIGCKKEQQENIYKIVDYTIDENSQLRSDFQYSDARVVRMF